MRSPVPLRAGRIGSFAADIVAAGGEAEVVATFERSLYLLCDKGIVAVCVDGLGNGPLNILVAARADGRPAWQGGVGTGAKAAVSASSIMVEGGVAIDLEGAAIWSPPAWPTVPATDLSGALAIVRARAVAQFASAVGEQGLAPLILAPSTAAARTGTADAGRAQVETLRTALPQALAVRSWPDDALAAAALLVGLGPGLTPSGDDLLGGLLLALTARGEVRLRDQLFDRIVDELNDLTVPVSAMHLTAAAHGMGHESLHALIGALITNDEVAIDRHVTAVAALGATSGWDAMAGVALGLSA